MPSPRRPAHTRRSPFARPAATSALDPITPHDTRRWQESRRGISIQELAARENVKLSTIQKSIDKMESHSAATSQESVEMATRQLYLESLGDAGQAIAEAIAAMKTEQRVITNKDTGETEVVEIQTADHATRMKAIDQLKGLLVSIQPKQPMMQMVNDNRTQINNGQPAGHLGQVTLSSESIIRQIRAERGMSLGPGEPDSPALSAGIIVPEEVDRELIAELEEDGDDDEIVEIVETGEISEFVEESD